MTPTVDPLMMGVDHSPDFVRNGRSQPMVIPPDGGKPVPYGRPSGFGKKLEDTFALEQWQRRMVGVGLARTPSLVAEILAYPGNPKSWSKEQKGELNDIMERAQVAAKANEAADIGTALHRMTEHLDLGETMGHLPDPFKSDLVAYRGGMQAHGLEIATHPVTGAPLIECRMVCDELQLAGTTDRVIKRGAQAIADLKTGDSIELAILGYAIQLAIYAHSDLYDVATGQRTPLPDLSLNVAFIIHLPAGEATFTLHELDIAEGWQAALCSHDIAEWRRKSKDGTLCRVVPFPSVEWPSATEADVARVAEAFGAAAMADPWAEPAPVDPVTIANAIETTATELPPPTPPSWGAPVGPAAIEGLVPPPPPSVAETSPQPPENRDLTQAPWTTAERIENLKARCRWIGQNKPNVSARLAENLAHAGISLRGMPDLSEQDLFAATRIIETHEAQADAPFQDLTAAAVRKPNKPTS